LRERGGGKVPFTEEQLTVTRGGLTVEQSRMKMAEAALGGHPRSNQKDQRGRYSESDDERE
jgi:hypothetical protein